MKRSSRGAGNERIQKRAREVSAAAGLRAMVRDGDVGALRDIAHHSRGDPIHAARGLVEYTMRQPFRLLDIIECAMELDLEGAALYISRHKYDPVFAPAVRNLARAGNPEGVACAIANNVPGADLPEALRGVAPCEVPRLCILIIERRRDDLYAHIARRVDWGKDAGLVVESAVRNENVGFLVLAPRYGAPGDVCMAAALRAGYYDAVPELLGHVSSFDALVRIVDAAAEPLVGWPWKMLALVDRFPRSMPVPMREDLQMAAYESAASSDAGIAWKLLERGFIPPPPTRFRVGGAECAKLGHMAMVPMHPTEDAPDEIRALLAPERPARLRDLAARVIVRHFGRLGWESLVFFLGLPNESVRAFMEAEAAVGRDALPKRGCVPVFRLKNVT